MAGPDAEVNRRHAQVLDAVEDLLRVGEDELAVVLRVQLADPRVEHLHGVHTGFDLRRQIFADDVGEQIQKACHAFEWPYISALVCAKDCCVPLIA
jgi:hypothetical protein